MHVPLTLMDITKVIEAEAFMLGALAIVDVEGEWDKDLMQKID